MGLFNRNEGGLMDVIRCDEQDYLVWKWRPGNERSKKENAVRWGSSLRVKDGEVAIFVYHQKSGAIQEAIMGPFDEILKTDNLPIISGIIGTVYAGNSPFQAEVYFINMAGIIQIPFLIPYFSVFDPRFDDFSCPVAVKGMVSFNIADYNKFIKLHRLIEFSLDQFTDQVSAGIHKYAKSFIGNAPSKYGFPVVQIERYILELSNAMKDALTPEMLEDFGVSVTRIDISSIICDKESEEYKKLYKLTGRQKTKQVVFATDMGMIKSAAEDINGIRDSRKRKKIERDNIERREKLSTEQEFIIPHIINTRMGGFLQKLGLGSKNASMQMESDLRTAQIINASASVKKYHVTINGKQQGPFSIDTVKEMAQTGLLNKDAYFWFEGMKEWKHYADIPELSSLFIPNTPPVPPTI